MVLFGRNSQEIYHKAQSIAEERGSILVNPQENSDLIVGMGTLGLEILEEAPDTEAVVVPLGGGGLVAGIAAAAKQVKPEVKVYGVQPRGADVMVRSLQAGRIVEIEEVWTIADGLGVKRPSEETLKGRKSPSS